MGFSVDTAIPCGILAAVLVTIFMVQRRRDDLKKRIDAKIQVFKKAFDISEDAIKKYRDKIEPWLTAVFQSEHLALLAGTGLTSAVASLAEVNAPGMDRIEFIEFGEQIKKSADLVLKSRGGEGAVRELVELILKSQNKWSYIVKFYSER